MKFWTIAKKDLHLYFVSPVAYIVLAVFIVISSYLFNAIFVSSKFMVDIMEYVFSNITIVFVMMVPLLTMRLLSEEKRMGTIEMLYTAPIRNVDIVIGKYAASIVFLLIMMGFTLVFPAVLGYAGSPDWTLIISGYIGMFLLGATFMAIGLLISSTTENQIVSAIVTYAIFLLWVLIDWLISVSSGVSRIILENMSLLHHVRNFQAGQIDTTDLSFYLIIIFISLFVTLRVVESRRWK